jgi:HPt (histidine-containing phosphotransfer) domain-containing protein
MASTQQQSQPLGELQTIPVLDRATLDLLREIDDGGLTLTAEMFEMFSADQPPRISALHSAIKSGDMARITELSHTIKGSAGTMGATRVRAVAASLEAYGKTGEIETPPMEALDLLKKAYQEAYTALDEHIKRG